MSGAVAIVQNDIKRVLAYSTISQLGYMVVGIGTGAVVAGMMHLFTHAFFKALLFLSAGAFIHAAHSNSIQDIARAGGAKLKVPMYSLLAGSFALAGLFPFAGFYSKDAILEHLLVEHHYVFLAAALLGVLVTSYYTFRVIFLMLSEKGDGHDHHLHTGSWMVPPLVLLMIGALFSGNIWNWAVEHWFSIEHVEHGSAALITALVSSGVALLGIFYSWRVFYKMSSNDPMERMKGFAKVLREKWYLDWSYDKLVHAIYLPFTWLLNRVELRFVKGALDGIGTACMNVARGFSRLQSGEVQQYFGLMLAATAVVILLITRL
jgi:NADH-quinone oxidoreductase subunit L